MWLMLLLNSLTENDVRLFGVPVLDLYLLRQAVQWRKTTGAIEKVGEQCAPLNKLNHTQVHSTQSTFTSDSSGTCVQTVLK